MAGAASNAGDADSSWAPGLTSGLHDVWRETWRFVYLPHDFSTPLIIGCVRTIYNVHLLPSLEGDMKICSTQKIHVTRGRSVNFLGWTNLYLVSKFSVFKYDINCNFVGYCTIPFGFNLFWHLLVFTFQLFKLHYLAKDHWWWFSTRNAHMVHIVKLIRFKMMYTC